MSTNQPHIFISHSHTDNEFGIRLVDDLSRVFPEGDAVWYDSHGGLTGGSIWWQKIIQEITSRSVFIVVLSSESMQSNWVNDEITIAWEQRHARGLLLIPLLYRPCSIRADLRTLQIIDFQASRDYELAFEELLVALGCPRQQPTQQTSRPPQQNLLTRLMPQIEVSFAKQDWPDVLRKSDYLLQHVAEDLPVRLYLLQGGAFHKKGQFKQAQGAFEMALVIVEDSQQRLDILKAYTTLLFSQEKWDDAIPLISEALDLLPDDPNWLATKQRAIGQVSYGYKAEQIADKIAIDSAAISVLSGLLKNTNDHEKSRLLADVLPQKYFYLWSLEEPVGPALSSIKICFREIYENASEEIKRKTANSFIKVVKEEAGGIVDAYLLAFFTANDLDYYSNEDIQLIKDRIFFNLSKEVSQPLIDRLHGILKFLTLEEVKDLIKILLKAKLSNYNNEAATAFIHSLYPDDNKEPVAKVITREYRKLINSLENGRDERKANDLKHELYSIREYAQFAYEAQHPTEDEIRAQQESDIWGDAIEARYEDEYTEDD